MLYSLAQSAVQKVRGTRNRLFNRFDKPVIILIYHRVTTLSSDPQMLAVSPENFRFQLDFLKKHYPVLRFEDDWRKIDRPSVVITFDDGYADNVKEALPIIEDVGIPVTFFVSTGNLDTRHEYWWDELERMILTDNSLPEQFCLNDERQGRTWPTGTLQEREMLYKELHLLMMWLEPERRDNWLAQLRVWADQSTKGRDAYRALSFGELQQLADSPWVTIGAHTVSHTPLSVLSEERQREEIITSRKQLEKITGSQVTTFSYPFGRKEHYNQTSIRLCREAGFRKVAANFPGQVHRWTDPMQLPRHLVRNWDPEVFANKLKGFWTQ
ncbi:MAG: polysaccharide deacetylase family protein [Desulfuromusa sp.]|nr:polysaccharide deacetylase family protein [Desulfuromusa sp.]